MQPVTLIPSQHPEENMPKKKGQPSRKRELRTYTASQPLTLRAAPDGSKQVAGYAIVWNSPSVDLGGFTEICSPSMLNRTLKESPDVLILRDHRSELLLGRTTAGTLDLKTSLTEPYMLICTFTVQVVLSILTGLVMVIIAYGAIGATIIGLLGPIFIPWMVFDKTDFLFWGWLKAFIGFEFYKVVAAATMSVMNHLLITYLMSGAMNLDSPTRLVYLMPGLLMLCFVAGFILLKIPTMTATLFSGHTGGHSSGMGGAITALILRAL